MLIYPGDGVTVIGRPGKSEALRKFTEPLPVESDAASPTD
jgi:hypothetical protein